jgi:hypothetical protein
LSRYAYQPELSWWARSLPAVGHVPIPRVPPSPDRRHLNAVEIEDARLRILRDMYVRGEFGSGWPAIERFEKHVAQALAGEQPSVDMPDPEFNLRDRYGPYRPVAPPKRSDARRSAVPPDRPPRTNPPERLGR